MKRSTPYVVNGIAMLVVFLLCRVLLMPYTYYLYGQQIGEKVVCIFLKMFICSSCFLLNIFTGKRDTTPLQVQMICRSIHARHSAVPRAKGVHLLHALLLRHAALLVWPHGQRGSKDANESES